MNFYEGKFADAEKSFLQANALNNAALGGGELYRAALCRYLLGDRAKADGLVGQYLELRQKYKDALVPVREAIWLYTRVASQEARQKIGTIVLRSQKRNLRSGKSPKVSARSACLVIGPSYKDGNS